MDEVEVSIICTVFNHEKFLKKCLDGFVMQKTSFKFEALIHDDCSTDSSKIIIEDYHNNYPDIIIPVYESENQYSKGINIVSEIMYPLVKGKYIAVCEGDDFWIDERKLQLQYEYMEKNKKCFLCTHNTVIHDLLGKKKDKNINNWKMERILSEEDVFIGWNVHSTSYMFRKAGDVFNYMNDLHKVWCGDYARLLYAFSKGPVGYIPEIMSVYNLNNSQGVTFETSNLSTIIKRAEDRKNFLKEYDTYTAGKYKDIIKRRICICDFDIEYSIFRKDLKENGYEKEVFLTLSKLFRNKDTYVQWTREATIKNKLKLFLITHSYRFCLRECSRFGN